MWNFGSSGCIPRGDRGVYRLSSAFSAFLEFRVSGDAQGDLGAGAHLAPDVALNIHKKKEN